MFVRESSRCVPPPPLLIVVLAIFLQQDTGRGVQAWVERVEVPPPSRPLLFDNNPRHPYFPKRLAATITTTTKFLSSSSSLSFSSGTSTEGSSADSVVVADDFKPSFYATNEIHRRSGKPIWKQRKQLSELKVGEQLEGVKIVQEHLEGVTGPKIFMECGIGTYNPNKQTWKMVNAMLRLGRRGTKGSVTTKRMARLRKKSAIECYVSRIRLDSGQLEVVLNPGDVPSSPDTTKSKVPVSALKPGQEVVGTVQKLAPYGVFVDVGSNRNGLLHIQKVADLYGSYIDKENGLKEAGLERGAKIKLQIVSNDKKRIFLDFTSAVKEEAETDRLQRQKSNEEKRQQSKHGSSKEKEDSTTSPTVVAVSAVGSGGGAAAVVSSAAGPSPVASTSTTEVDISQQEADAWAAYTQVYEDDDYGDEDYDDYDEDRDIEDALGLGTY